MDYDFYRDHLTHHICKHSWGAEALPESLDDTVGRCKRGWGAIEAASALQVWERDVGFGGNGINMHWLNLEQEVTTGDYVPLTINDDALILFSANTGLGSETESGPIFRFGRSTGGGAPQSAASRLRMINTSAQVTSHGPFIPGELLRYEDNIELGPYLTDLHQDDLIFHGCPSTVFDDYEDGMCAIAIDRVAKTVTAYMWSYSIGRSRYDGGELPSIPLTDSPITLLNDDFGGTSNTFSIQGLIYGCGTYAFPKGKLPSDWRKFAVEKGNDWRHGNFEEIIKPQNSGFVL